MIAIAMLCIGSLSGQGETLILIALRSTSVQGGIDWRAAYERWQLTRKSAIQLFRVADKYDQLDRPEEAKRARAAARGMLEEKTFAFLDIAPPDERCTDYLDSVIELSLTALDFALPNDTQDDLRDRLLLDVLDPCRPGDFKYDLPRLPWASRWTLVLNDRLDPRPGIEPTHTRTVVTGTIEVPRLPTLVELLVSRAQFEELVRYAGKEYAYALTKFDAHMSMAAPLEAIVGGEYEQWRDASSGSTGNNSWSCTAAPHKTTPVKYALTLSWNPSNAYGVHLLLTEAQLVSSVTVRCEHYHNGNLVEVNETPYHYQPRREFVSSYWDVEELLLRNGEDVMDRYETFEELRIALRCLDRCPS